MNTGYDEKRKKLEALKTSLKTLRDNVDAYYAPDLGSTEQGILRNTSSHLNKIQINFFALSDRLFKEETENDMNDSVKRSPRRP